MFTENSNSDEPGSSALTTSANGDAQDNYDDEGLLLGGMRNFIGLIAKMQAENDRNPRSSRVYHMPDRLNFQVTEDHGGTQLNVKITFKKYGRFTHDLILPIFIDLTSKPINKDAIEYLAESEAAERALFGHENEPPSMFDRFVNAILYPFTLIASGLLAAANALSLIAPNASKALVPHAIRRASLLVRYVGLAGSIIFFVPLTIYYLTKYYYRAKLENKPRLSALFDEIEADIKNGQKYFANEKLTNLPRAYQSLLDSDSPNFQNLRYRYFWLLYLINDGFEYREALKYAINDDEKLQVLIQVINKSERTLENVLDHINSYPAFGRGDEKYANAKKHSLCQIAKHLSRIPTDTPLYHELHANLHAKLQACITSLRNQQYQEAQDRFYEITLEGYLKYAYPDLAILYYQLESIIVFLSKKKVKFRSTTTDLDELGCLLVAKENVAIIRNIVSVNYPEKAQEYNQRIDAYEKTLKALYNFKEPNPREYEVEELPELFTPAAAAAKQKAKNPGEDEEIMPNDVDDLGNVRPRSGTSINPTF